MVTIVKIACIGRALFSSIKHVFTKQDIKYKVLVGTENNYQKGYIT